MFPTLLVTESLNKFPVPFS